MKGMFECEDLQMIALKLGNIGDFHALKVLCRGSETQLEVEI